MTKMKIYTEPVKQQHVTHWDRDYLPSNYLEPKCPACRAGVSPGQPACTECGEQLFVEHPGTFRRDAKAVQSEAFRDGSGGHSQRS